MLICKADKSYKCSKIRTYTTKSISNIRFSILEPITPSDIADLFDDNTFYFYDDEFDLRLIETNGTKLVGLRIDYNEDSTCKITIKLLKPKRSVANEGKV